MEEFLRAEGNKIDALFAHNDDMAIGAIRSNRGTTASGQVLTSSLFPSTQSVLLLKP